MFMIKTIKITYLIPFFLTFFLTHCNKPRDLSYLHGQANLLEKSKQLSLKFSNKNDIIKILGESVTKDPLDNNIWYYTEVLEVSNIFGRKKIKKNNLLIIKFNKSGILENKTFYDISKLNNIELDQSKTNSLGIDNSIIKSILKTSKKRIQNQSKNLQK